MSGGKGVVFQLIFLGPIVFFSFIFSLRAEAFSSDFILKRFYETGEDWISIGLALPIIFYSMKGKFRISLWEYWAEEASFFAFYSLSRMISMSLFFLDSIEFCSGFIGVNFLVNYEWLCFYLIRIYWSFFTRAFLLLK